MVLKKRSGGVVEMLEGVRRQNLAHGDHMLMVKFFLRKGKSVPVHTHEEEQTGYLISGRMKLSINGVEYLIEDGDSWNIDGNVPHGADMLENCVAVEVFSPPREDYME